MLSFGWSNHFGTCPKKVKTFKANTFLDIKADKRGEEVRRPNFHLDIKAKILLETKFFEGN